MDQFVKVAGREGKVGGCFCRLLPLNENTDIANNMDPDQTAPLIGKCIIYPTEGAYVFGADPVGVGTSMTLFCARFS